MNLSAKLGLNVTDFLSSLKIAEGQSVSAFSKMQREVERLQSVNERMLKSFDSTPFTKLQERLNSIKAPTWQKEWYIITT